jgi:TolA-binding protein
VSDDFLAQLSSALEAEHDGAHPAPDVTRARVLERLASQRRRRMRWIYFGAPLLALGLGSSALAASGVPFNQALAWLNPLSEAAAPQATASRQSGASRSTNKGSAPATSSDTAPSHTTSGDVSPPVVAPVVAASPDAEAHRPAWSADNHAPRPRLVPADIPAVPSRMREGEANAVQRRVDSPAETSSTASSSTSSTRSAATEGGLELYRQAHDAHFKQRNFEAARANYNEYLRRYPSGALAPEARYNLAICETELGNKAAAQKALEAFERDAPPSYRDDEARSLREALDNE